MSRTSRSGGALSASTAGRLPKMRAGALRASTGMQAVLRRETSSERFGRRPRSCERRSRAMAARGGKKAKQRAVERRSARSPAESRGEKDRNSTGHHGLCQRAHPESTVAIEDPAAVQEHRLGCAAVDLALAVLLHRRAASDPFAAELDRVHTHKIKSPVWCAHLGMANSEDDEPSALPPPNRGFEVLAAILIALLAAFLGSA